MLFKDFKRIIIINQERNYTWFIYLHLKLGPLVLFLICIQLFLVRRIKWKMLLGILLGLWMHVGHLHLLEKVCMHFHCHAHTHNW